MPTAGRSVRLRVEQRETTTTAPSGNDAHHVREAGSPAHAANPPCHHWCSTHAPTSSLPSRHVDVDRRTARACRGPLRLACRWACRASPPCPSRCGGTEGGVRGSRVPPVPDEGQREEVIVRRDRRCRRRPRPQTLRVQQTCLNTECIPPLLSPSTGTAPLSNVGERSHPAIRSNGRRRWRIPNQTRKQLLLTLRVRVPHRGCRPVGEAPPCQWVGAPGTSKSMPPVPTRTAPEGPTPPLTADAAPNPTVRA
jgi:hypothetical protein